MCVGDQPINSRCVQPPPERLHHNRVIGRPRACWRNVWLTLYLNPVLIQLRARFLEEEEEDEEEVEEEEYKRGKQSSCISNFLWF